MKNKIVVWGTNAADEKVLIALELKAEENKVLLYTFPEAVVTEGFYHQMMHDWKNDKPVDFPEHTLLERELAVTDSLLPDDLKTDDRSGVIQRAQTEWHFVVLSTKLHQAYQQELAEFKEKISALQQFDTHLWEELRAFWEKVQEQARERNLFRTHVDILRDNTNELFEKLRLLRDRMQEEARSTSQVVFDTFIHRLADIEQRIASGGAKLNAVFEELKNLQRDYREAKLSNEHRNRLWERIDAAFKAAKERRFGPGANEGSLIERFERRIAGLKEAVQRVEDSIRRDEEDLAFQNRKIATTEGQLEAQIRVAKIKMIEERLNVKREKLKEILGTLQSVERQLAKAKEKEAQRLAKEAERKRLEEAKAAAKAEIDRQIAAAKASPEAQEAIPAAPGDSALDVATRVAGEALQDALDTARAIGQVLGEKAEEWMEEALEKAEDAVEDFSEKAQEVAEDLWDKVSQIAKTAIEDIRPTPAEDRPVEDEAVAADEVEVAATTTLTEEPSPKKRTQRAKKTEGNAAAEPPTDKPEA